MISVIVSLAMGFMRGEGHSVIRTSAACVAPWQVEGWWGRQSPILTEDHGVKRSDACREHQL